MKDQGKFSPHIQTSMLKRGTSYENTSAIESRDCLLFVLRSVTPAAKLVIKAVSSDGLLFTKEGKINRRKTAKATGLSVREVDECIAEFSEMRDHHEALSDKSIAQRLDSDE